MRKFFKFTLSILVLGSIIYFMLFHIRAVSISGISMFPTLYHGDYCIMYKTGSIKRGDIVCFVRGGVHYAKRIIGVPGDIIKIDNVGIAFCKNGKFLYAEENYLLAPARIGNGNQIVNVPNGYFFVMGDNRHYSYDSRDFGLIDKDNVYGKIICRFLRIF